MLTYVGFLFAHRLFSLGKQVKTLWFPPQNPPPSPSRLVGPNTSAAEGRRWRRSSSGPGLLGQDLQLSSQGLRDGEGGSKGRGAGSHEAMKSQKGRRVVGFGRVVDRVRHSQNYDHFKECSHRCTHRATVPGGSTMNMNAIIRHPKANLFHEYGQDIIHHPVLGEE